MALGRKTGGRKKGTPNKMTQHARDAIAMAADKLGGVNRLVAWAKEDPQNERTFWATIYTRLVPVDMNHSGDINHTHEQVTSDAADFRSRVAGLAARAGDAAGTGKPH